MIEHTHVDQTERGLQIQGQELVGAAGFRQAGRVVVGKCDGGSI